MSELPLFTIDTELDGLSRIKLSSPIKLPNATGYLWNRAMVMQVNCRGYVNSQFMQPEPAKYSYAPNMEAKSFIQPEHSYFSHHPGRFFYLKDEDSGEIISLPYEPKRVQLDKFSFELGNSDITWLIEHFGLQITIKVNLTKEDLIECWLFSVKNLTETKKNISVYPYFSIGYMSWMNQSATFDKSLNAIVAHSVTPYQKVADYFANKQLKDTTFFLSDTPPTAWHANQKDFEGEGGLHQPSALVAENLGNVEARYETPVAVMQFQQPLLPNEHKTYQFLFGPVKDTSEIDELREKYLGHSQRQKAIKTYHEYISQSEACLTINSNNDSFDDFVNHWLPRQMYYHGDVNRLSTDPQTRNYIQDNMGMAFINSKQTREAYILAVSQQAINGAMPEGVLLHSDAKLKYINQVPHADHGVWLPICLSVYLNETADVSLLSEMITFADSSQEQSFICHIELALDYLLNATDRRGLSFIEQGDWCDPMNMVGYKGQGVSTWLSLATAYALNTWCDLCNEYNIDINQQKYNEYRFAAKAINAAVNKYLWHGQWFARGITDDGRVFGTDKDLEGKIFLNPQSWSMLSGAANEHQQLDMIEAISEQLITPQGVMMLAPSYTRMVEDIGRITQKHPGVSENGSVYNHAAIFYIYALYQVGQNNLAFELLCKMLPSLDNAEITGQLPVYIPNYYRGAFYQFPEQAGRSSHLFNTGTTSWLYRCLVEELCGLKGCASGLRVAPKIPASLQKLSGQRIFREAIVNFDIEQTKEVLNMELLLDKHIITGNVLTCLQAGQHYQLQVRLPKVSEDNVQ
ncbi:GH36-type glycosyl hydrolase domain-containing protein [Colwellia psychrerythraea]|uniref:Glycosyltransferase 36 n=1 Tax=Colwellia psychrerythraea TaxID=28229 RepID=A0A099KTH2_COLPS|nr:NdvB protein [Colwellia psychrerythraea]KGJ93117.1 glycosyltransferase 36 [Colwellia psychrerythraea]